MDRSTGPLSPAQVRARLRLPARGAGVATLEVLSPPSSRSQHGNEGRSVLVAAQAAAIATPLQLPPVAKLQPPPATAPAPQLQRENLAPPPPVLSPVLSPASAALYGDFTEEDGAWGNGMGPASPPPVIAAQKGAAAAPSVAPSAATSASRTTLVPLPPSPPSSSTAAAFGDTGASGALTIVPDAHPASGTGSVVGAPHAEWGSSGSTAPSLISVSPTGGARLEYGVSSSSLGSLADAARVGDSWGNGVGSSAQVGDSLEVSPFRMDDDGGEQFEARGGSGGGASSDSNNSVGAERHSRDGRARANRSRRAPALLHTQQLFLASCVGTANAASGGAPRAEVCDNGGIGIMAQHPCSPRGDGADSTASTDDLNALREERRLSRYGLQVAAALASPPTKPDAILPAGDGHRHTSAVAPVGCGGVSSPALRQRRAGGGGDASSPLPTPRNAAARPLRSPSPMAAAPLVTAAQHVSIAFSDDASSVSVSSAIVDTGGDVPSAAAAAAAAVPLAAPDSPLLPLPQPLFGVRAGPRRAAPFRVSGAANEDNYDFAIIVRATVTPAQEAALARAVVAAAAQAVGYAQQARAIGAGWGLGARLGVGAMTGAAFSHDLGSPSAMPACFGSPDFRAAPAPHPLPVEGAPDLAGPPARETHAASSTRSLLYNGVGATCNIERGDSASDSDSAGGGSGSDSGGSGGRVPPSGDLRSKRSKRKGGGRGQEQQLPSQARRAGAPSPAPSAGINAANPALGKVPLHDAVGLAIVEEEEEEEWYDEWDDDDDSDVGGGTRRGGGGLTRSKHSARRLHGGRPADDYDDEDEDAYDSDVPLGPAPSRPSLMGAISGFAQHVRRSLRMDKDAPPGAISSSSAAVAPRPPPRAPPMRTPSHALLSPALSAALSPNGGAANMRSPHGFSPLPESDSRREGGASRTRKCAEILAALRAAGLFAKRVRSLSRRTWLIKVACPEWRLELEAEKLRLRMRLSSGGWAKFRRSLRTAFMPSFAAHDEVGSNALPSLFHSSDRQALIDHILRSSGREGGADLGESTPLGAFVSALFPLHMQVRLEELRSDLLAPWRPSRTDGARDRVGLVDPSWYAPPRLIDIAEAAMGVAAGGDGGGGGGDKGRQLEGGDKGGSGGGAPTPGMPPSSSPTAPFSCRCLSSCCALSCMRASCRFTPVRLVFTALLLAAKAGRSVWRMWRGLCTVPLDRVAAYFGEASAFYFAWLTFYTRWLVLPSILGILLFCAQLAYGTLDVPYAPLYALATALWSVLFLEAWKRHNAELAQRWGVLGYEDEEAMRPQFVGEWKANADTGEVVRVAPRCQQALVFALTLPATLAVVCSVVTGMILLFSARDQVLADFTAASNVDALRAAVLAVPSLSTQVTAGALALPLPITVDVAGSMANSWRLGVWGFLSRPPSPWGSHAPSPALLSAAAASGITVTPKGSVTPATSATPVLPPSSSGGFGASSFTPGALDLETLKAYAGGGGVVWWLVMLVPPIALGLLMPLLDGAFSFLAKRMNDAENHATESGARNGRIAKVFLFRFVVAFISLFWYAFSPHASLSHLAVQLASFLLVGQTWRLFLAVVFPTCMRARRERAFRARLRNAEDSGLTEGRRGKRLIRHAQSAAWRESRLPRYDPFDDYSAALIQFGHVTFFAWAFPLAPVCALGANLLELRAHAFTLCYNTQRPIAHKAGGIGVWYTVLEAMALAAVLVNCAHLVLDAGALTGYLPDLSPESRLLLVFVFEHCVLALRLVLPLVLPAMPGHVKRRAARDDFALVRLQLALHSKAAGGADANADKG